MSQLNTQVTCPRCGNCGWGGFNILLEPSVESREDECFCTQCQNRFQIHAVSQIGSMGWLQNIAELRGKPTAEETLHLLMGATLLELISNTDNITSASRYIDHDGKTFHVSVRRGERGDTEKDCE